MILAAKVATNENGSNKCMHWKKIPEMDVVS